ncbi:hypothetical protein [Thermococcus sp.]|uniref:hypothetical protein n=1 Tax=Thermococcus sp. TaxID=35749 RepID=UPI00261809EE|nr:hypothetical protein [Thermococcus sp.]
MRSEDKACLPLAKGFLVLLLSVVWTSNWQYETKLKVSLVMAVPVLVAVSVILTLQRWMRKTLLAYSPGLKMRANNYEIHIDAYLRKLQYEIRVLGGAVLNINRSV